MAVKAQGYAVLESVWSAFGLLDNMVALDFGTAELVADATVPAAGCKRRGFHGRSELIGYEPSPVINPLFL